MPRSTSKTRAKTKPKASAGKSPGAAGVALITGASRGIGAELARQFARGGYDLVLVARNRTQLLELAAAVQTDYGCHATTIATDLGKAGAAEKLYRQLAQEGHEIDVLVNNVGVLDQGKFTDIALENHLQLVNINISVLTALTHLFLKPMRERGSGKVLNVASLSAFMPVPTMAVYAASKAYVVSFSEALYEELKGTGVSVTAVCPGFVSTDMVAGVEAQGDFHVPAAMLMSPQRVAEEAYTACMENVVVYVPGVGPRLSAQISDMAPRALRRIGSGMLSRMLSRGKAG